MKYVIICGNIGMVHATNNMKDAKKVFNEYVQMSKDGYGRASREDVYLIHRLGDIICEHFGTNNEQEES